MTADEKQKIDDATKLRHCLWIITRRLNWLIAIQIIVGIFIILHKR